MRSKPCSARVSITPGSFHRPGSTWAPPSKTMPATRRDRGPGRWAASSCPSASSPSSSTSWRGFRLPGDRPWRGAALLGADLEADVELLDAFNRRHQDAGYSDRHRRGESYLRTRGRRDHRCGAVRAGRPTSRFRPTRDPMTLLQSGAERRATGQGANRRNNSRCLSPDAGPAPLPPKGRRARSAVQGHGRTAPPAPRDLPPDIRRKQSPRQHVRLPQPDARRGVPAGGIG